MRINLKFKMGILTAGLLVFSTSVLGVISLRSSRVEITKSVNQYLDLLSEKAAVEIRDMNEAEFSMLRSLANLSYVTDNSMSTKEINRTLSELSRINKDKYENVAYYDAYGDSYTADGRLINFKGRPYFEQAMAGNEFVTDPIFSNVTNNILQFYSVPVYGNDGQVTGVMASVIKGDRLSVSVEKIDIGDGYHPVIINQETGAAIVDVNSDSGAFEDIDKNPEMANIIKMLRNDETGRFVYNDPVTKTKMAGSFHAVENAKWSVYCAAPYDFFYQEYYNARIAIVVGNIGSIIITLIVLLILLTILFKPLVSVKTAITEIASGNADLSKRIPDATEDEIGDVVKGFNSFTEKLQEIVAELKKSNANLGTAGENLNSSTEETAASIHQIIANIESIHGQINSQSDSVNQTAGAVNEIASNIESLERMINTQSMGVEQASSAVEQMMGNISSVNQSVEKMAESFEKLEKSATQGASIQTNTAERIEQIRAQSETLVEANKAIASIASETNLLAMNAAIEAAHAGDAGKGFSVVADEIRKLSETSGQQSKTIGDQLNNIRGAIEAMVDVSYKSTLAFEEVNRRIEETDQLVRQIKGAMEEQAIGSKQITNALSDMNDSTLEVKTAAREMTAGNKAILDEIQTLQNVTSVMKNSMQEMSVGAARINETGSSLSAISNQMHQNIDAINVQIDKFEI